MDLRCGLDIVELERIERALTQHGSAFKNRVYTKRESEYCDARGKASIQSYAARFSAKEAVSKALGTGIAKGVSFLDIEIINDEHGKPRVLLHGEAKKIYEGIGGKALDISLTHSRDYAAAQAVILT
ncbi:MAG: holo-ACP synthase [Clostridia bacterium]|nr:holo-ACP synthase [Clostridia bacterium]